MLCIDLSLVVPCCPLSLLKTHPEQKRKIRRKNMHGNKTHRAGNRQEEDFFSHAISRKPAVKRKKQSQGQAPASLENPRWRKAKQRM